MRDEGSTGLRGVRVEGESAPGTVRLRLDDGREVVVPAELVVAREGRYHLPSAPEPDLHPADEASPGVLPVVEEQARIDRRRVHAGTVRVSTHVSERREAVELPGWREQAEVVRVAVDRPVDAAPPVRREGGAGRGGGGAAQGGEAARGDGARHGAPVGRRGGADAR